MQIAFTLYSPFSNTPLPDEHKEHEMVHKEIMLITVILFTLQIVYILVKKNLIFRQFSAGIWHVLYVL